MIKINLYYTQWLTPVLPFFLYSASKPLFFHSASFIFPICFYALHSSFSTFYILHSTIIFFIKLFTWTSIKSSLLCCQLCDITAHGCLCISVTYACVKEHHNTVTDSSPQCMVLTVDMQSETTLSSQINQMIGF